MSPFVFVARVELSFSRVPPTTTVPLLRVVTPVSVLSSPPGFALVTTLRLVGAAAGRAAWRPITPGRRDDTGLRGGNNAGRLGNTDLGRRGGRIRLDALRLPTATAVPLLRVVTPVSSPGPCAGDGAPARAVPLLDERLIMVIWSRRRRRYRWPRSPRWPTRSPPRRRPRSSSSR